MIDARDEFAADYCLPAMRANALYMDRYPLVSALSRPLIVKHLVAAAAQARRHDRVARLHRQGQRPGPLRGRHRRARPRPEGDRAGPGLRLDPGQGHRVRRGEGPADRRVGASRRTRSTRTCGAARWRPASWRTSGTPRSRTSTPTPPTRPSRATPDEVVITFDAGVPVADRRRDRHPVPGDPGAQPAGRRAGRRPARHGRGPAGRHQEPRGVRGAGRDRADHRPPGAGDVTVERDLARFKRGVDQRWGELVYDGLWFSPLKHALDAFIDDAQQHVTGEVRLTLHGGRAVVTGRRSEASLYDFGLATYDTGDTSTSRWPRASCSCGACRASMAAARDARLGGCRASGAPQWAAWTTRA